MRTRTVLMMGELLCAAVAMADTFYVSTNGTAVAPYDSWTTAATTIQDAVDAAAAGDTVLVTNGVYDAGGRIGSTGNLEATNRVVIGSGIELRSVNGPDVTFIVGAPDPLSTNGPAAVRGVYLESYSSLSGFTITDGHAWGIGGGFRSENYGVTVSNCVITGCTSGNDGGGAYITNDDSCRVTHCTFSNNVSHGWGGGLRAVRTRVDHCRIVNNQAKDRYGAGFASGGGIDGGTVVDSLIARNSALTEAGGAWNCKLINCTVADNSSEGTLGNGISSCTLTNCIVYGNSGPGLEIEDSSAYFCRVPSSAGLNAYSNIITNDPRFIDSAGGNYRISRGSPCINAGDDRAVEDVVDLAGRPRVQGGGVDMGCYETDGGIYPTNYPGTIPYATGCFVLEGTNSVELTGMMWVSNATLGVSSEFPADSPWTASPMVLAVGTNILHLYGTDISGQVAFCENMLLVREAWTSGGSGPVRYASSDGKHVDPFTTWEFASTNLQPAVDCCHAGDTVMVSNMVCNSGSREVGATGASRVVVTNQVHLRGIGSRENNRIVGSTNTPPVRCLYLGDGASASGLTLTNGYCNVSGYGGGGAFVEADGLVSNCWVVGCGARNGYGGGIRLMGGEVAWCRIEDCFSEEDFAAGIRIGTSSTTATVHHCEIVGCQCTKPYLNLFGYLGGAIVTLDGDATLRDSLICESVLMDAGGGMVVVVTEESPAQIENCTITATHHDCTDPDYVRYMGAIVGDGSTTVRNCIIARQHDTMPDIAPGTMPTSCVITHSCAGSNMVHGVNGNITNAPSFIDWENGDYRLAYGSPCINSGTNEAWMAAATDFDGNPRMVDGTVDMGAFEYDRALYDSDEDGLIDADEIDLFGTSPIKSDTDGDSSSDYNEYIADTSPTNPADFFQILKIDGSTVSFDSSDARLYTLLSTTNLVGGQWSEVGSQMGAGGPDSMSGTNNVPAEYFKLEVEVP